MIEINSAAGKRWLLALGGSLLLMLALGAAPASAQRPFTFGFADDRFSDNLFTNPDPTVRSTWLGRVAATGASYARINVYWSRIATSEPLDPTDPNDPAYDWSEVDDAVASVVAEGLRPVLLILNAPAWAEGPDRPADPTLRRGNWKPRADAYGHFAEAIARRYDGSGAPALPKVEHFEAWNEPNLPNYLSPQWHGKQAVSPNIYRQLLTEFHAGIKAADPANVVITGGTAPYGDAPGGKRMRPLVFWRAVLCLNRNLRRTCAHEVPFDVFGHNAINGSAGAGATVGAAHRDDATPADFDRLRELVRAAEQRGSAPGRHQLWSTETWYESKPEPSGFSLRAHARTMVEAMYVLWTHRVSNVIFLQVRDTRYEPGIGRLSSFQTGVYRFNGKPKPAAHSLRFPFVIDRGKRGGRRTTFWGIPPRAGVLQIECRRATAGWRTVARTRVQAGKSFALTVRTAELPSGGGPAKFRARVQGLSSPVGAVVRSTRRR